MSMPVNDSKQLFWRRLIFCIVLAEFCFFIFSGVSFSFLQGDQFFNIEADPFYWVIYALYIPQYILSTSWLAIGMDIIIILLLLWQIYKPANNRISILLFIALFIFYLTLTGYLTHRNYQAGIFLVFIPFMFTSGQASQFAFEATRYFLLLFYLTAGVLKLFNPSIVVPDHFSQMLPAQFAPYFIEGNTGVRTSLNLYLIHHPGHAYLLYLFSVLLEMTALIGFFTKKFDRLLGFLFLAFHFANWFLMDIGPIGHIGFLCLLLFPIFKDGINENH